MLVKISLVLLVLYVAYRWYDRFDPGKCSVAYRWYDRFDPGKCSVAYRWYDRFDPGKCSVAYRWYDRFDPGKCSVAYRWYDRFDPGKCSVAYRWYDRFDPAMVKGKHVIVTGASTGIGEQIAYHYARMGASVVVTARTEKKLQQVVKNCKEFGKGLGSSFHYVTADMERMEETKKVVDFAVDKFGGIDVLVLNHILPVAPNEWTGSSDNITLHERVFKVNFFSYVRMYSYAMPIIEKAAGRVIVMSSVTGVVNFPLLATYGSTKYAINGFFGNLQMELLSRKSPASITRCTIGLISTDNAIKFFRESKLGKNEAFVPIATPSDTALAVIKGGTLRETEVFYPVLVARFASTFPTFVSHMERFTGWLLNGE
ncbi:hydroxysteroid 11-beta-dehydrogenase 1-like protein [Lineus longissimus]|uniref:hydroxysteroid 11-beta-dehydrogenase 1-like protein n=1 Tax=Lineus longissimus TaxID=88925 RepID=UPI002B4F926F